MSSPPAGPIRVLIVDDHPLVRAGLRARLSLVPYIEVVADTASGELALDQLQAHGADVLLVDINMPGTNGIELARTALVRWPQLKVIVLSMFNNREYVIAAVRVGVRGYVLKDSPLDEIVASIDAVWSGGTYYSRPVSEVAFGQVQRAPRLTTRELEVLLMLAHGGSNKSVATRLGISVRTAEAHRLSLRRKLGVDSASELLKLAVAYGWTTL